MKLFINTRKPASMERCSNCGKKAKIAIDFLVEKRRDEDGETCISTLCACKKCKHTINICTESKSKIELSWTTFSEGDIVLSNDELNLGKI